MNDRFRIYFGTYLLLMLVPLYVACFLVGQVGSWGFVLTSAGVAVGLALIAPTRWTKL